MKSNKLDKVFLVVLLFIAIPKVCLGECLSSFSPKATYEVCFTPNGDCAHKIIETIARAKKQILVQAYVFTDMSIAKALVAAKRNGVDVKIILDKSEINKQCKLIKFLRKHNIKVIIVDCSPAIAHNKIIIADEITITSSYNYSFGARRNLENIILINDAGVAKKYIENWYRCESRGILSGK